MAFSYTGGSRGMLALIGLVLVVESVGMHFLVSLWSLQAAIVLDAISVLTLVALVADHTASTRRPILVTQEEVIVRAGLRWTVRVPMTLIERIERPSAKPNQQSVLVLGTPPDLALALSAPVEASGPLGTRKRVTRIETAVDDRAGFTRAVEERRGLQDRK